MVQPVKAAVFQQGLNAPGQGDILGKKFIIPLTHFHQACGLPVTGHDPDTQPVEGFQAPRGGSSNGHKPVRRFQPPFQEIRANHGMFQMHGMMAGIGLLDRHESPGSHMEGKVLHPDPGFFQLAEHLFREVKSGCRRRN